MNIIVSGGTGSGKTTLLNVLSSSIPGERAPDHDRGGGRAQAGPRARGLAGGPAGEHRGARSGNGSGPGAQRPADAAGPDHRRRGALRRGARHAPGDEHRPRGLAVDLPRQLAGGPAGPVGDDGDDGGARAGAGAGAPADRGCARPDRPHLPAAGRHPPDHENQRGDRARRVRAQAEGRLRLPPGRPGRRGPGRGRRSIIRRRTCVPPADAGRRHRLRAGVPNDRPLGIGSGRSRVGGLLVGQWRWRSAQDAGKVIERVERAVEENRSASREARCSTGVASSVAGTFSAQSWRPTRPRRTPANSSPTCSPGESSPS